MLVSNCNFPFRSDAECRPVCEAGCVHGDCVAPDVCRCRFSFVGPACDAACRCNMHSACPGLHRLDACLDCRNDTAGDACGECRAGFVGDPRDGGRCESCLEYCNGMSEECFAKDQLLEAGLLRERGDEKREPDSLNSLKEI